MAEEITIDGKTFLKADDLKEALILWGICTPETVDELIYHKSPPPPHVVYVLQMSNTTVKIGVTQDITQRKKTIKGNSGLNILKEWCTDLIPRRIAYKVEALSHKELEGHKTQGEFFDIPFDDACFTVALYTAIVSEGEAYKEKLQAPVGVMARGFNGGMNWEVTK